MFLPGSPAVLALVHLLHKWYTAMDNTGKTIQIVFLNFLNRKAFDLIDHNKLLESFTRVNHLDVRPALFGWFGSYLQGRSQLTTFQEG